MDTRNVSAQLYFKQLPEDKLSFNCENTFPNLSTCVNNVETDKQIENAFQKQLELSEMYKSPKIFNKIKEDFMDQTMEAENTPAEEPKQTPEPPINVPTKIPVGPTDFLFGFIKERFGSDGNIMGMVITVLVLIIIIGVIILSILNPKRGINSRSGGGGSFNRNPGGGLFNRNPGGGLFNINF